MDRDKNSMMRSREMRGSVTMRSKCSITSFLVSTGKSAGLQVSGSMPCSSMTDR